MARKRIEPEIEIPMERINFMGARIVAFGRNDKAGWVVFGCSLGKQNSDGFKGLFNRMGWALPGEHTKSQREDGLLRGGSFQLVAQDKLVDEEVDIEYKMLGGFAVIRLEQKKDFRRELRFKILFECEDGCANLEAYMMRTDNARGSLKVMYLKEPVQTKIPDAQMEMTA